MFNSVTPSGMVEKQLKPRGIRDESVIKAMSTVPRERFLDPALSGGAYHDCSLPIGSSQTISKPYIVAFMLQNLRLTGNEKVLDIGTGSGYQAAVLSQMCKSVYSVERIFHLAARAKKLYDELNYYNISVKVGNGYYGWKEYAPYSAIVVAACAPNPPKPLLDQLALGGKLVIPLSSDGGRQRLWMYERINGGIIKRELTECMFVKFIS